MLAYRTRNLLVVAMSWLVLASGAAAWGQTAAKTPKDALANLGKALEKADKALFLASVDVAPADKEMAGVFFDFLTALDGVARDAAKAYGKEGGIKAGGGFPSAEELSRAVIKEEGDNASATDPNNPEGKPIPLVKKGGTWLVDMTTDDVFKGDKAKMTAALKEAVKDVKDLRAKIGKPEMDAQKAGEAMMGIVMKMATADAGGAAPSPAPAPSPTPATGVATTGAATEPAGAAEGVSTEGKDLEALWNSMIHFMDVARPDVAKSYADAILKKPEAAGQLYTLADKTRNAMVKLNRAAADKNLKPAVDQIIALIEKGYATDLSDPKRIAEAIQLLFGTERQYTNGADRLAKSGEYSVPQLVQSLRSNTTPETMRDRIGTFLPRLGLAGVRPMAEALQSKDAALVERLAIALGQIGYPHAAPMLKEVLGRPEFADGSAAPNVTRLRRAVQTALNTCLKAGGASKSAPQLYYDLAEQYYRQDESLRPGPAIGNVWFWNEEVGLSYKAAPAAVFCDVYAMRNARTALRLDQGMAQAVSLWLAADIKREADLSDGAKDPTIPEDQPPASVYSLAAGAKYLQEVLERGLKDKNVAVAVVAIQALSRTAGAKSLVIPASGGSLPLVDAMSFGDGRVRFLAAVTLGSALPQDRFAGWERVVPTLNDALLLSGGKKRAALIGDAGDASNKVKGVLRAGGWDVQDGTAAGAVLTAAASLGGVDLVVIVNRDDPAAVIRQVRKEPATASAAVLVIGKDSPALTEVTQQDKAVKVLPPASADEAITAAAGAAKSAAGSAGLTEEQQGQWAARAAGVIRLLADTGNKVFDVRPAMGPLMELVNDKRPEVRLAAASALAAMPAQAAQQAIARLALVPDLDEKVRITALNTACESVRRFGNQLAPDQEKGVQELVGGKGSPELRDAAAQLLGALSLSSEKIKGMLLEAGPK